MFYELKLEKRIMKTKTFYFNLCLVAIVLMTISTGHPKPKSEKGKWDYLKEVVRPIDRNGIFRLHSDLKIKVHGEPTQEDLATLNSVITELDTLLETIGVKLDEENPNVNIYFQLSTGKYEGQRCATSLVHHDLVFNAIQTVEFFISEDYNTQDERNLLIWELLVNHLGKFNETNWLRYGKTIFKKSGRDKPGLAEIDKFILKKLYSKDFRKHVKQLGGLGLYKKRARYSSRLKLIIIVSYVLLFLFFKSSLRKQS